MWFAPHVARRTSVPVRAQVDAPDLLLHPADRPREHARSAPSRVEATASVQLHERETTAMDTSAHAPSAITVRRGSVAGLRIKWDRTIVFLTGAALVLAAVLTGIAAPFTAVTWAVPVVLLLLGAGCVAGLRYLAVTDRPGVSAQAPTRQTAPAQHAIFDNEDQARQDREEQELQADAALDLPAEGQLPETVKPERPAAEKTYSVAELRAEALKVARSSAATGSTAATWEPVPVPKPLYTQAPVVQRRAPEPLRVPQRPAATTTSLKDAVRAGEQESAALNLDDVLKRRRA